MQKSAERVALLAGDSLISTTDVLALAYARRKLLPLRRHHYRLATRALERIGTLHYVT